MSTGTASYGDVALQHVLISGLTLLRNEPVDDDRRIQVTESLVHIFGEADRGSPALGAQNLLLVANEQPAFERFVYFFHYLKEPYGQDLPKRLAEVAAYFSGIQEGRESSAKERKDVEQLFECLLEAIEKERALKPLIPPQEMAAG